MGLAISSLVAWGLAVGQRWYGLAEGPMAGVRQMALAQGLTGPGILSCWALALPGLAQCLSRVRDPVAP